MDETADESSERDHGKDTVEINHRHCQLRKEQAWLPNAVVQSHSRESLEENEENLITSPPSDTDSFQRPILHNRALSEPWDSTDRDDLEILGQFGTPHSSQSAVNTSHPSNASTRLRHAVIHFPSRLPLLRHSTSLGDIDDIPASCRDLDFGDSSIETISEKGSKCCTCCGGTWQQRMVLLSIAVVDFSSFCCLSILAPFFPKEVAKKGLSNSISGLVFSVYALVCFLLAPIFGKLLPYTGPKFMFIAGSLFAGICCILFGFLDQIEDPTMFALFCFLVRGMEALGAAAFGTAGFTFVAHVFPDNIGAVMGVLEIFVGLGLSAGPAIGGALYSLGGYFLPFLVLGTCLVLSVPINMILLPAENGPMSEVKEASLWKLVKFPPILMTCIVICMVATAWSFLDPTLEPHLRDYQLSPDQLGLLFLLVSAVYALFSPIWGWIADRSTETRPVVGVGLVLTGLSFLLLGPSPILASFLPKALWLNILSLALIAIFGAAACIPTFEQSFREAREAGFEENIATYGIVSGLWSSVYSLGEVLGPSVGGILMDHFGFPLASDAIGFTSFGLGIMVLLFHIYWTSSSTQMNGATILPSKSPSCDETEPLLGRNR